MFSSHLSAGDLEGALETEGTLAVARGNDVPALDDGVGVLQLEVRPVVVGRGVVLHICVDGNESSSFAINSLKPKG